nr:MAG TPA: hypothetical protein [Caudoviricetes sp.]
MCAIVPFFFCNLLRIEKNFYIDTIHSTCHIMLR